MHHDTVVIFKPEITAACRSNNKSVTPLSIGARKLRQIREVINHASGGNRRRTDAANPQSTDRKRIALPLIVQHAGSGTSTAKIRNLYLFELNGRRRRLSVVGTRFIRVKLRVPKMFSPRRDTFERADENSNTYWDSVISYADLIYGMQALVAGQIQEFKKFRRDRSQARSTWMRR
jgi:hypothetical protein